MAVSERSSRKRGLLLRRTAHVVNLALFLAALVTIAIVVNYFGYRPELRLKLDATKTRAYSLSEQTKQLLDSLEGDWTVALIMVEASVDAATRQQVDEVLRRYEDACEAISIVRVDPTIPQTLGEYEAILARLRELEKDQIGGYEKAITAGISAFEELHLFAQQQAAQLEQALGLLDGDDPARLDVQQRLGLLGLLAQEGQQVLDAVEAARKVSDAQPIPDYEVARSILAQALSQWADELFEMARIYRGWRESSEVNPLLARFAANVEGEYQRVAQRLAVSADPLAQLPVLELASIGRQLQSGEVAVIIGPDRSAVIPSAQLFPQLSRELSDDMVAFDSRFRGEQVISAAIRSLLVEHMPMVVFAHAEQSPMFREDSQRADLVSVATLLKTSRFDVREWSVGSTDRPVAEEGQPVVWVIIPPIRRQGLEPDKNELALIRAVENLIAGGEAVMLNLYPSLLPRYRQADPWQRLGGPLNLKPDTARAIFEETPLADGQSLYEPGQTVRNYASDHPVCVAANGRRAYFPLPVPLELIDSQNAAVRCEIIAEIQRSQLRWLEEDWARMMTAQGEVVRGEPFEDAIPIMIAANRPHPLESGQQRFILVGSGGWLLSGVADAATSIGGDRAALTNPGNSELMLASVAWLAEMDELIAPSPLSRQVASLDGIDGRASFTWFMIAVIGLPAGCLALGVIVWIIRRI